MAHYLSRGQLHMTDTRDEAGEAAVQHWSTLTEPYTPHCGSRDRYGVASARQTAT
jgi:hypothetical protein